MKTAGIDYDTRKGKGDVHVVTVDDDSGEACYYALPIPGDSFAAMVAVRAAFKNAPLALREALYEDVYRAAIEEPYSVNRQTNAVLNAVKGAVVACLPTSRIHVVGLTAQQWKRATVGRANASKDDVREWAWKQIDPRLSVPVREFPRPHSAWPQDAFDAYCLARAARGLNAKGIAA